MAESTQAHVWCVPSMPRMSPPCPSQTETCGLWTSALTWPAGIILVHGVTGLLLSLVLAVSLLPQAAFPLPSGHVEWTCMSCLEYLHAALSVKIITLFLSSSRDLRLETEVTSGNHTTVKTKCHWRVKGVFLHLSLEMSKAFRREVPSLQAAAQLIGDANSCRPFV